MMNDGIRLRRPPMPNQSYGVTSEGEPCWEGVTGKALAAMRGGGEGIRPARAVLSDGTLDLQE
jgi:hypothetical protein